MMDHSRVTQLLGCKYPLIQGGMAWVADSTLAAAVSNAGGLGLIAAANAPADVVRQEIRRAKTLTDKPFGVNIMMMSPSVEEVAKIVVEEGVQVVTTGAGTPAKYMPAWKEAGIKIVPVIASVAQAKRMERMGADALVAEGCEAGGHIGELTTMTLVPQVVDAVNIPVLAAGGIADGRGVAAAFLLGAEGVQVGTRFLASEECTIAPEYKEMVLKAKDIDTAVTGRVGGHPVRQLKNAFVREILAAEKDGTDADKLEEMMSGSLRRAAREGDVKNGSFMAGQIAGLVKDIKPVAQIIEELFSQASALLKQAGTLL